MPALKVICMQDTYWNHVTGCSKYHDSEAVDTVLSYCVQECKTPSSLIGGYGVNVKQASYEMQRLTDAYGKSNGLHLRHMVLSFSNRYFLRFVCFLYSVGVDGKIAAHYDFVHPDGFQPFVLQSDQNKR